MPKGNIKAFINAMAALYLLNIYYKNDSWLINARAIPTSDWSMGSSVFTILPPATNHLWFGNKPIVSKSPFVASYTDEGYLKIKQIQNNERQAAYDYLITQPEVHEAKFQQWWEDAQARNKGANIYAELGVYRINKKIPPSLPFEERKRRLIQSPEWALQNKLHQKPYNADEISKANIQSIIDFCGSFFWHCNNAYHPET